MSAKKFFTFQRVNDIKKRNSSKAKYRKGSVNSCELCYLAYVEHTSGELGVCSLCDAKATQNTLDEEKGLPTRF